MKKVTETNRQTDQGIIEEWMPVTDGSGQAIGYRGKRIRIDPARIVGQIIGQPGSRDQDAPEPDDSWAVILAISVRAEFFQRIVQSGIQKGDDKTKNRQQE